MLIIGYLSISYVKIIIFSEVLDIKFYTDINNKMNFIKNFFSKEETKKT